MQGLDTHLSQLDSAFQLKEEKCNPHHVYLAYRTRGRCFPQKIEPSGGALDFLCLWFFPARLSKLHAHLLVYAAFFLLRRDELAFGRGAAAIFWPGVCLFWQILALWPDGR